MRTGVLAKKIGMTRVFGADGAHIPVTVLSLEGCQVVGVKKNEVRETPGRFVGKAKDNAGRDCIVMVMSTREQHIRKDKATSNICSNQAFIATIAGTSIQIGRAHV